MKTNSQSSSFSEEIFSICAPLGYKIFIINNALYDITKKEAQGHLIVQNSKVHSETSWLSIVEFRLFNFFFVPQKMKMLKRIFYFKYM